MDSRGFVSVGRNVQTLPVAPFPEQGRTNLITSVNVVLQCGGRDLHHARDRFGIVEQCGSHYRFDHPQLTLRGSLVSAHGRRSSGSSRALVSLGLISAGLPGD